MISRQSHVYSPRAITRLLLVQFFNCMQIHAITYTKHCVLTIILTDDTTWSCVFGHLHDIISIQEAVINICFHVFVSMFC